LVWLWGVLLDPPCTVVVETEPPQPAMTRRATPSNAVERA
jgi:hypothetical protein